MIARADFRVIEHSVRLLALIRQFTRVDRNAACRCARLEHDRQQQQNDRQIDDEAERKAVKAQHRAQKQERNCHHQQIQEEAQRTADAGRIQRLARQIRLFADRLGGSGFLFRFRHGISSPFMILTDFSRR